MNYSNWISLAEEKEIILKREELFNFTLGEELNVLLIDEVDFLSKEYPRRYGVEYGVEYSMENLVQFRQQISLRERPDSDGIEKFILTFVQPKARTNVDDYSVGELKGEKINSVLNNSRDGYLCFGSGDGWTRFVLWEKMRDMPSFRFERDENYYIEGIHREDSDILCHEQDITKEREKFLRQGTEEEKELILNHTNDQLYDLIEGGDNFFSFKYLVRRILRKRNGLPEPDVEDSEDEAEVERDIERIEKLNQRNEEYRTKIMLNGSDDEKRLVSLPKETLDTMTSQYPYFAFPYLEDTVNDILDRTPREFAEMRAINVVEVRQI